MNLIKFRYKNLKPYNKFCATELIINNNNIKQTLYYNNLYNYLKQSFRLKHIYIDFCDIKTNYNTTTFLFSIYFGTLYLNKIKKRSKNSLLNNKKSNIKVIPNNFLKLNKCNNIFLQFNNLNNFLDNKKASYLYQQIKNNIQSLLKKRRYIIIDFIRLTTLLIDNKINVKLFATMINQLFSNLSKKNHNRFFLLIKKVFKIIINDNQLAAKNQIKGIKLKIAGRIRGKTRSDTRNIVVGTVPLQAHTNNLEFYKQHIFTVYGTFGLKIWISRI